MTATRHHARARANIRIEDCLPFDVKASYFYVADMLPTVYTESNSWLAFKVESGVLHAFLRHHTWGHAVPYICVPGHTLVIHPTISHRFVASEDCKVKMMAG